MNRFIVPAILLGLVAFLAYGLLTTSKKDNFDPPAALQGKAAPIFALKDPAGKDYDLAALKGKPIVVNFWASWCNPCHAEAPLLAEMSKKAGDVQFLGVLYNDTVGQAEKFSQQYGLTYPTLLDPGSKAAMKYGVGTIPMTYVIDRQGQVVFVQYGEVTEPTFSEALRKAGAKL